jgi:hypothetical protein
MEKIMIRDTATFSVYQDQLRAFKQWVKKHYSFAIVSIQKDGGYYQVQVSNKYQFELWDDLKRFYIESIKI